MQVQSMQTATEAMSIKFVNITCLYHMLYKRKYSTTWILCCTVSVGYGSKTANILSILKQLPTVDLNIKNLQHFLMNIAVCHFW